VQRIGRYELHDVLGRGGSGVVWSATFLGPGGFRKPVAVKILDTGQPKLAHEARLGGLLRHPNLVEAYALEQIDDTWICAMERVDGGSLAGRGPLPPRAVVQVGLAVCMALEHAHHELDLIHLDIKPANLLLAGATVKVADLGIARPAGSAAATVIGTRGYMAPEQVSGGILDARTDIYALGVVLHELATGHQPASGVTPRTADVPWLAEVLSQCLARDPADRFDSMGELADALIALDARGSGLAAVLGQQAPLTGAETFQLTIARPRTNLDALADVFFGRKAELARLTEALGTPGVHTLKGPAGIGKTRLARTAAAAWLGTGREAWFCDLASAQTLPEMVRTIAGTLEMALGVGDTPALIERMGASMARRGPVVLILDNFEQLVPAARDAIVAWAAQAPELRLLITSRQPLGVAGEHLTELGPLPIGDAVAMLADRGGIAADDPDLTELAYRLDRLPLALELAAPRLRMLAPRQLIDRLDRRMQLLSGGNRTLVAALDASWALLGPIERAAIAQLSVFHGRFDVEAAEAILKLPDGAPWAVDVVSTLLEHSLLVSRDGWLRLYDSTREWASAKLGTDRVAAEVRHGAYFARYRAGLREYTGPRRKAMAAWLAGYRVDIEAACRRAIVTGSVDIAMATCRAAWAHFESVGPVRAGGELVAAVLEMPGLDDAGRAELLCLSANAAHHIGDTERCIPLFRAALALAEDLGNDALIGMAHGGLGMHAATHGTPPEAAGHWRRARAACQAAGVAHGVAQAVGGLAVAAELNGEAERAEALYREALALFRGCGDRRGEGVTYLNLASLMRQVGRLDDSEAYYGASLVRHREIGDRRFESLALTNLGNLEFTRGNLQRALALYDQALVANNQMGNRREAAATRMNMGAAHGMAGRLDQARVCFEHAAEDLRDVGDHRNCALALENLARVLTLQARPHDALIHVHEALEHSESAKDGRRTNALKIQLSVLSLELGDVEAARMYANQVLASSVGPQGAEHAGEAHVLLANIDIDTGQLQQAREHLEQALVLQHGTLAVPDTHLAMGRIATMQRDLATATHHLDTALALSTDLPGTQARALARLAVVDALQGQRAPALGRLRQAREQGALSDEPGVHEFIAALAAEVDTLAPT
jgi:predicted ATPase